MKVRLQLASVGDVADLVAMRSAVDERLKVTERATLFALRNSSVYIARSRSQLIATLTLATKKPWAIDKSYFTPGKRPLYLTAMAVHPDFQRRGVGMACIEEACRITLAWPGDAIRLDAYDTEAGAGEFYRKCGFREVGRAVYRSAPLIYFEMLLQSA